MIAVQPQAVRAEVSAEIIDVHGLEAPAAELANRLASIVERQAYTIGRQSVSVREVSRDKTRMIVMLEALWSPKRAAFFGGEYDGQELEVRRETDGLPLSLLRLPYRASPSAWQNEATPHVTAHPTYKRVGIDPTRDVWVYSSAN